MYGLPSPVVVVVVVMVVVVVKVEVVGVRQGDACRGVGWEGSNGVKR